MQKFYIFIILIMLLQNLFAQDKFFTKGIIQYECKINNHKNFGNSDDFWVIQQKEFTPEFSTIYYSLSFDQNKSLFNYIGLLEQTKKMFRENDLGDNIWFNDFNKGISITQKNIFGEIFLMNDSIKPLKWKLIPGETRDFANFPCKKAVTVIYDSVYVFAFFTENILLNGGPMNFNGLPGTILGITIPRLHTSIIATAFNIKVAEKDLVPPKEGKVKPKSEVYEKLMNATKNWGIYGQKAMWQGFL